MLCALGAAAAAAGAPAPLPRAFVEPSLAAAAAQDPARTFDVIVETAGTLNGAGFLKKSGLSTVQLRRQFHSVDGDELSLTGDQITALSRAKYVKAIVANDAVQASGFDLPRSNAQKWPWTIHAPVDWTTHALALGTPTIAVVDSGVDGSRLGGRLLGQTTFVSSGTNSPGDGYGHGTFVAGIAAGSEDGLAGVAPQANVLSLDVMNDAGIATVSDVIAACDWILANKDAYDIRVANFSLHSASRASLFFDPLDLAVERLWLNGVVVVAASGNYAVNGAESGVTFAPGNDPFVLTVGAADIEDTVGTADDVVAPFSAWGYTPDGFAKPDLAAPGRYLIGPVPAGAELTQERPDHVIGGDTMQLSGTSFAAPAVAGAAALILARHPDWTPDDVKGALLGTAQPVPAASPRSLGAGELDVAAAEADSTPSNPNAGLDRFVTPAGFDSAAWQTAASTDAAWGDAAWSDAAWSTAAWGDAAWGDAAWGDAAWGDAAKDSALGVPATLLSNGEMGQLEQDLGITGP